MNFNLNPTKALVITGQMRLKENQNPTELAQYHINYFKPDFTYFFLWDYEFKQYGEELSKIPNSEIIVGDSNFKKITDFEMQHLILQLRKYALSSIKRRNEDYDYDSSAKPLLAYMMNPQIKQQIFSNLTLKYSNYIISRYDIHYVENINKLQMNDMYSFLDTEQPTIATPFGGDAEGIGLGDLVIFANKPAAKNLKNYYNDLMQEVIKQIAPSFPEGFLRYMFVNYYKCEVYRFNFPCTTNSCLERDGYLIHANLLGYNIIKQTIPIPIAPFPKNEIPKYNNPAFDLPLVNPIM